MGNGSKVTVTHTQGAYWPDCTCVVCEETFRRGGPGPGSSAGPGIIDALHTGSAQEEIGALRQILAVLVEERGGVIHIWGTDLASAPTRHLQVEKQLDPWALVVKVVTQ